MLVKNGENFEIIRDWNSYLCSICNNEFAMNRNGISRHLEKHVRNKEISIDEKKALLEPLFKLKFLSKSSRVFPQRYRKDDCTKPSSG